MSAVYPNQPGYLIYHNPTITDFKKSSIEYQDKLKFGEVKEPKSIPIPRMAEPEEPTMKRGTSYSQDVFQNPYGSNIREQFEPDFVKLDKQVLRFYAYFKESVVENELENARIRLLVIYYYLLDDSISIVDVKQENSGIPQGPFLSKGKVYKEDGTLYKFSDFVVGKDVYIYGKVIRIYDCDAYTRDFFQLNGFTQPQRQDVPADAFQLKVTTKPKIVKDHLMKDYLEYSMGGGKVKSAKQFLENDRKVLSFDITWFDDVYDKEQKNYKLNYYLADGKIDFIGRNDGQVKIRGFRIELSEVERCINSFEDVHMSCCVYENEEIIDFTNNTVAKYLINLTPLVSIFAASRANASTFDGFMPW